MKKLIALIISILFCTTIYAGQIKQIIFLGDSLSDNGNLYQKIKIIPKSPPYFNGRFTNGPTWAENVGKFFYNKSYVDYHNYAIGGATAIQHNPFVDKFAPPITLTGEVYDYLFKSLFVKKSDILYGIWIGANDYLYNTKTSDMNQTSSKVVDSIAWSIITLAQNGAKNFLVLNLPDMARTPYAQEHNLVNELHAVSIMHNKKLAEAIKNIQSKFPNIKIVTVDIYTIFNDVLNNPSKYNEQYGKNFTNFSQACWQGSMMIQGNKANYSDLINTELKQSFATSPTGLPKNFDSESIANTILNSPSLSEAYFTNKMAESGVTPCSSPEQYIFWDHIHPSEQVHQLIASIVESHLSVIDI